MAELLGALDRSGNPADARRLEPATAGIAQAGFSTAGLFSRAVVSQIKDVMTEQTIGNGMTGISAGDGPEREGLWGRVCASSLRQESRDGQDGYHLNVWGGSFGYDRRLFSHLLVGFGGSSAQNRIRSNDDQTQTDVESWQGNIYGSLSGDAAYLDAVLSFAWNSYNSSRRIVFGGLDRTARGDSTGRQYAGYIEGGYTIRNKGLEITPIIALQAVGLHLDEYTEMGAGAANLTVEKREENSVQTGLKLKMAYPIRRASLSLTPELHAGIFHDFAGENVETTARLAGGGTAFTATGCEPSRSSLNIGAKLTLATRNNLTFLLGYDFELREYFTGHAGFLQIRYAF
jgi:outer membrane autotransporter protein